MAVDFEWDTVTIGTSIEAMEYAFNEGTPILFNQQPYLFEFEDSPPGETKKERWERLASDVAMRGLNPFADKITSIRVEENSLEVICGTKKYKVFCKEIIFFDDENIENFPFNKLEFKGYHVYDWFIVRSGASHEYDFLESGDDFVKKIYFFSKINLPRYKDCVSCSTIEKDKIDDFDFSSTMARMKTIGIMEKAGIKGTQHTRTYRYPIKLEFIGRKVVKIKEEIFLQEGIYTIDSRRKESSV